jgi:hypothetical protein
MGEVMRTFLFWDVTQCMLVGVYRLTLRGSLLVPLSRVNPLRWDSEGLNYTTVEE